VDRDRDLAERWATAATAVTDIRSSAVATILFRTFESIGRLDVRLRAFDPPSPDGHGRPDVNAASAMTDHLDLSRLWLLDAYEAVRTLGQCEASGLWSITDAQRVRLRDTKTALAIVRMPLAKLEPRGQGGKAIPGSLVALPTWIREGHGAAWWLDEKPSARVTSRRWLADSVLWMLSSMLPRGEPTFRLLDTPAMSGPG
jgi:hypothetical protein